MEGNDIALDREGHISFLQAALAELPGAYASQEVNRLTLAHFAVTSLDILNALNQVNKQQVTEWVYSLQVVPPEEGEQEDTVYGFRGSPSIGVSYSPDGAVALHCHDNANLASTYSALAVLRVLGDDYSGVRKTAILSSLKRLQQPDGSFCPIPGGAEADLRFIYCAAAICQLLGEEPAFDTAAAIAFVRQCQGYDHGFGLSPGCESHGGATYCAIASMVLMDALLSPPSEDAATASAGPSSDRDSFQEAVVQWCLQRQTEEGGFQGRANKPADACYAFWIGASLSLLESQHLCDPEPLRGFLLTCQNQRYGGFSKHPGNAPDLLHTFYGLCGLALLGEEGLKEVHCVLGITQPHVSL